MNIALSFLVFPNDNFQFLFSIGHYNIGFTCFGINIALLIIPKLTFVNCATIKKGNLPFTIIFITPVRWNNLFPTLFYWFNTFYLKSTLTITFYEVKRLCGLWYRLKMKYHIPCAIAMGTNKLIKLNTIC